MANETIPNISNVLILLTMLTLLTLLKGSVPKFEPGMCIKFKDSKQPICKVVSMAHDVYTYQCDNKDFTDTKEVIEDDFEGVVCHDNNRSD